MSSIPTICPPVIPSLVPLPPNDWIWTVVKYARVEDLEDLMLKCYEALLVERPTIKSLMIFPLGSHVVQKSQRQLPEYRRAGLLLSIFTFTSLSQTLMTNILGRYYRHRDAWRFRSFMGLMSKAVMGEEPFASRDLVWLVVDLLTKYLTNWDLTGKHVPTDALWLAKPLANRQTSLSSSSSSSPLMPKVVVIEDDDDEERRRLPVKRKLGVK